ncbi:MAG: DUF896 domain-containing protein [Pseudobutyrivibrio sp.]|nr:DUF896 domain-containing protein [Pseudobutyrivibrio sp.]
MTEQDIARINELYHKSKSVGLTEAEAVEQKELRQRYIQSVKNNLKAQLNNIDLVDENGNVENLGQKYNK